MSVTGKFNTILKTHSNFPRQLSKTECLIVFAAKKDDGGPKSILKYLSKCVFVSGKLVALHYCITMDGTRGFQTNVERHLWNGGSSGKQ